MISVALSVSEGRNPEFMHVFLDLTSSILILGTYFPEKTTSQEMMKIFAFANSLVELLSVGLETFNRARYRQFVKRIGQLIK